MIPPYIIEQIRRREEQQRHQPEQPQIEIPLPTSPRPSVPERTDDDDHGVVIIDL
jgi:hypothetical protein